MNVLDSSALLAFLQGEPGAAEVMTALATGSACAAVNWSEVAKKIPYHGGDWPLARSILESYGLVIEPVTAEDAEAAAALWRSHPALSLADRCCLALAQRLDADVLTTDQAWGGVTIRVRLVR